MKIDPIMKKSIIRVNPTKPVVNIIMYPMKTEASKPPKSSVFAFTATRHNVDNTKSPSKDSSDDTVIQNYSKSK